MTNSAALSSSIAEKVASVEGSEILEAPRIGESDLHNEMLIFIKPEAFLVSDTAQMAKTIQLVLDKVAEFDASVAGVAIVGGQVLDDLEIMSQHYGLINRLSRSASTMLDDADRQRIAQVLGVELDEYQVLGGHEYLARYSGENAHGLEQFWAAGPSSKVRSGFYVRPVEKDGDKLVLVNAFHPSQLLHFTDSTHRIVLMLVQSNTPWTTLKNEMGGATFPEKASARSIRGTLYANPQPYGFESVGIANNVVHLSAGPFEALYEINNFFGKITDFHIEQQQPRILRRMIEVGMPMDKALDALNNPVVTVGEKTTDLFSATEDKDTDEAVGIYQHG
jgi:hypothetical protein